MEDISSETQNVFQKASSKIPIKSQTSLNPDSDFSFMKKRVTVNAVDKHIKEYQLD